ncbi:hypothetical protein SKAU_G00355910 [Synaphobranchus kaupii]|uniref:Uncharacterized protein n=1 Tax=Synaphobranchus kaupii TaxID=118154 RepID=A0A9Q1IFM3_SYNKA|nr:hypothetical protein SKAU_G00355910 [Synaphobranchus kaupii]
MVYGTHARDLNRGAVGEGYDDDDKSPFQGPLTPRLRRLGAYEPLDSRPSARCPENWSATTDGTAAAAAADSLPRRPGPAPASKNSLCRPLSNPCT